MIVLNISTIMSLLRIQFNKNDQDIYIAAKQISQYLVMGYNFNYDNGFLYQDEQGKENFISLSNNRIVKSPGFEIICFDVDELEFYVKDSFIHMKVKRNEKDFDLLVGNHYIFEDKENEE